MSKRKLPRELLTDEESDRLLEQCDTSLVGMRNRALLLLLEGTGCRISEALALEVRDLDWEAGTARIRRGNGGHERLVPVSPEALVATRRWLRRRGAAGINPGVAVCCSLRGRPLTAPYVRRLLPQLGRQAAIQKRVHAHGLRHRFTSRMVRHGVVITSISYVLGHQSVASTYEYLRKLGLDQGLDQVQKALDAQDRFPNESGTMKTHDFVGKRKWGYDYTVTRVEDGGMRIHACGWGSGIEDGDLLVLENKNNHATYRVESISYFFDPPDQWSAELAYVGASEAKEGT